MKSAIIYILVLAFVLVPVSYAGDTKGGGVTTTDDGGEVTLKLDPPDDFEEVTFNVYLMVWWEEDKTWTKGAKLDTWKWVPGNTLERKIKDEENIKEKGTALLIQGDIKRSTPRTPDIVINRWHVTGSGK